MEYVSQNDSVGSPIVDMDRCMCGCPAKEHRIIDLTEAEHASLASLRSSPCWPATGFVAGLLEDSIADTMGMRLEREDFTYGEVHDATFLKFLNSLHRSSIKCGNRAGTRRGAGVHGGSFYDMGCGLG